MKKIVIIGAGPGGLYTAARLIKNNAVEKDNITIIDPRAGEYTRPGHLFSLIFKSVGKMTGVSMESVSSACHIKELERFLHTSLKTQGLSFVKETFVGIHGATDNQPKGAVTKKENGKESIYEADYIFDCSGTTGQVAQAVNRYLESIGEQPFFSSSSLVTHNTITDHLLAHVSIPNYDNIKNLLNLEQPVPDFIQKKDIETNIELREKLQAMGWHYEAFPTFYFAHQKDTTKVCLYMETPVNLPKEKQSDWIKLLLSIYSENKITDYSELKKSSKYDKKPRIMGFKVQPHYLNKAIFEKEQLPTVIVGFDALRGVDYRYQNGFDDGTVSFNIMMKHFTFASGSIERINSIKLQHDVFENLKGFAVLVNKLQKLRHDSNIQGHKYFFKIYHHALKNSPNLSKEIKQKYQLIAGELAYQYCKMSYPLVNDKNGERIDLIHTLNFFLRCLLYAQEYLPAENTVAHHDINRKLQSLVKEISKEIFDLDFDMLRKYYYQSMEKEISKEIFDFNFDLLRKYYYQSQRFCGKLLTDIVKNFETMEGTYTSAAVRKKILFLLNNEKKMPEMQVYCGETPALFLAKRNSRENNSPASSSSIRFFSSEAVVKQQIKPESEEAIDNMIDEAKRGVNTFAKSKRSIGFD